MALSVETSSSTSGLAVASLTWSHTITNANKIVVTAGLGTSAGHTIASVTFNGDALTKVDAITDGGPWTRAEIWERHTPDVVTGNVVVTYTNNPTQAAAGATGFIDAATALGTPSTRSTAGTNPSLTVVDSASGDIVISVVCSDASGATTTPGGTQQWEVENLDSDIDVNCQTKTASGASTVCSWTNSTSDNYTSVGVAVKPAPTNVQQPLASLWPILVAG